MKKKLLSLFAAIAMAATVSAQVTYTCTAGTNFDGSEGTAKLFDNDVNTKFCGNTGSDVYALVTASEPVYVWGYDMTTANDNEAYGRLLKHWALYGTNDPAVAVDPTAEGWVTLSDLGKNDMVQKKNFYTQRFFCEKGVNKPFKYFKLTLTEGDFVQFSEFKILGEPNRVVSYKWKASSQDNSKKAVDLLLGQKWEGSNLAGNWVTIETGDGQAYAVKTYSFSTHDDGDWHDRAPKSWKIEGSNDNSNWTLIDERTNDDEIQNANYTTFEFTPANTTDKFRYIKLTLNAMKSTGWTQVGEFHVHSTSDVSDAQYYTNLVNTAKATKAEYEALLGENDPWCQEYATFFAGLDLDGVLATAISSGEYEALEAKLAEAENNAIAQAMNLFVNGANYAAIAGSGDKCWGDGHYSQLFDGKDGCEGRPGSKWGGNNFPQYVIFRVKEAFKPFFYKLVTGNDTQNNNGRNWKDWNVYGGNFTSFSAAADSSSTGWTLLDERTNVSEEYLPMKNFYPATFDFNKGVSEDYLYYMVKVIAPHSGNQQQMSEMYLCTQAEFEAIREPLVAEFAEFAAGLDALVVESDKEADKATFAELYSELQTTADAVRLTKVYNDLVALKEALEESSAFAMGGYRCLSGNTAWGDGENWTKLIDGNISTKWGGGIPEGGSYVIFKTYAANSFGQYELVTGNDTKNSPDRNWKNWKIYGATFESDEAASRDAAWTLIDQKENIGQDRLPGDNFAPAFFSFSETWPGYNYFKIEVEAAYNNGGSIQMSEFKMLSDNEYAAIRQEYVDSLTKVSMSLADLEAELDLPAEVKEQLMAQLTDTIGAKIGAVAVAPANDLLPLFNAALSYIVDEVPSLIYSMQLIADENGVYQLGTAKDVANFASLVNVGNPEINAVLTGNVDLSTVITADEWTSIGNNNVPFKGTFDGQGYTISGITYTAKGQYNGLFGKLSTGAVVKNFTAEGTMTVSTEVTGRAVALIAAAGEDNVLIQNINSKMNYNNALAGAQVGGILGGSLNGTITVDRCTYSGTLDGNDAGGSGNYGGIVGYVNNNSAAKLNVTNCLFDGQLVNTAATPGACTFGGIVGYVGANPTVAIKNCLSIGSLQSAIVGQFFGAVKSAKCSISNSYYKGDVVNGSASTVSLPTQEVTLVNDEQLASGEIAVALGDAFRQNLGEGGDAYPVLDETHGVVKAISEAGYATMYVAPAVQIPEGVEAYTGEFKETWLKLNAVNGTVPGWEPVVLKGDVGIYCFMPVAGASDIDVPVDFSAMGFENAADLTTHTVGSVSLTFSKATGQSSPKYYVSGSAARIYKGNTLRIQAPKPITKIVFNFNGNNTPNADDTFSEGSYDANTKTWTGSTTDLTFTKATSGQVHIKTMTVTYEGEAGEVPNIVGNVLKGADEDIDAAGKYVLAKPEGKDVGFYLADSGIINAGKVYLELPEGSTEPLVKAFYFTADDATGIDTIENGQLTIDNAAIYNIAGQRVSKMQKGINIVNGKKVLY